MAAFRFPPPTIMSDRPENPTESPAESTDEMEALSASDAAKVMDSLERNRNKILIGVALAAIAVGAVLIGTQMKKQKHLAASRAYSVALGKKEVAAFDAVVVEHAGTIAAGDALLSKAELQNDQGKLEDARATLESFVADFPEHPRHAQGLFALANLFHISDDLEKASSYYEQTISAQPDGELTPLARIRLGDIALEKGETETAEQRYQESFALHPGNPFVNYAEEKISLLAVGEPPVVKRPEPEPAPEASEPATEPANGATPAEAKGKGKGKATPKDTAKTSSVPEKPEVEAPQPANTPAPAQPE